MLGCRTRGCSFTRALLGISADEIHLCGDAAAVPLIQDILSVTGDHLEVIFLAGFTLNSSVFLALVCDDILNDRPLGKFFYLHMDHFFFKVGIFLVFLFSLKSIIAFHLMLFV